MLLINRRTFPGEVGAAVADAPIEAQNRAYTLEPPSTWHESMFTLHCRALAHDGEFPEGMLNKMAAESRRA